MTNNTSLPCDIVQDLLPSYVDGILSDTSTCAVAKHLQSCKTCHDMYDDMVTDELRQDNTDQQEKEIDYLKKVRSKTRHFTLAAILIAVLLAASGTAVYFLIFSGEYILNSVKYSLQVSSNSLKIEGILPDDFTTGTQKIEEKDGVVSLTLPAKRKTFFSFHKNYEVSYTAKATIHEVRVNGDILWQNGTSISTYVNRIYDIRISALPPTIPHWPSLSVSKKPSAVLLPSFKPASSLTAGPSTSRSPRPQPKTPSAKR